MYSPLRQDSLRSVADLLEKLRASRERLKKLGLQCDLLIKHPNSLTPSILEWWSRQIRLRSKL